MATALELLLENDDIPVSRRLALSKPTTPKPRPIAGRDVNWRAGLDAVDPDTGLTPLMMAAIQGNHQLAAALVDRGATIDYTDEKKGRTALHFAARFGQLEVINELLKRDALVNNMDNLHKTALMLAAKGGYFECVKALILRGASVNKADDHGFTALHYAARFGHQDVVQQLVNAAAAIEIRDELDGKTALHWAAQYGRKETVIVLLNAGAKVNRRTNKEKMTALMLASREGYKNIVSILISRGGDANMIDIYGWTALHFACSWGRRDTAHILIVEGISNVNARNSSLDNKGGIPPLIVAAKGGHAEIVRLLLNYGADIHLTELQQFKCAIHWAATLGLFDIIQILLDYGTDINIPNEVSGMTALMYAASAGKRGAMIVLLNNYADMNILDKRGLTAVDHANRQRTRDMLMSAIVNIDPLPKTNLIPWLEKEVCYMERDSMYGGPNVFLNSVLYSTRGLLYGLYSLPPDRDVYLLYCVVMLLAGCDRSMHRHPYDRAHFLEKMDVLDEMLQRMLSAQEMSVESVFTDCFVIGHVPAQLLGAFDIKYFASAFFHGPLALYLQIGRSRMLDCLSMQDKIHASFHCCLKDCRLVVDGFGRRSGELLSARYCPAMMFLLEGAGQLFFLAVILYYTTILHDSSLFSQRRPTTSTTFTSAEFLLLSCAISTVLYEVGLLEEKRWAVSPSIVFDFADLHQTRMRMLAQHFLEHPFKLCDLCIAVCAGLWILLRVAVQLARAGQLSWMTDSRAAEWNATAAQFLLCTSIPLSLGLLRYPAVYVRRFGVEVLTICYAVADLLIFVPIFAALCLGFGAVMYAIFRDQVEDLQTPLRVSKTLFNAILKSYDDGLFDRTENFYTGLFLGGAFLLLAIVFLFNAIVGNIAAKYAQHHQRCEGKWIWMKCRLIQQYSLVLEKSPLAMLPPPWNLLPAAFYGAHVYYAWRARLAVDCRRCLSIAGVVSDLLVAGLFVWPAAAIEYYAMYIEAPTPDSSDRRRGKNPDDAGFLYKVLRLAALPVCLPYVAVCLFLKVWQEPWPTLLVKSRLSDGRLRLSYGKKRDFFERQTLSRFEDRRLNEMLRYFNPKLLFLEEDCQAAAGFQKKKPHTQNTPAGDRRDVHGSAGLAQLGPRYHRRGFRYQLPTAQERVLYANINNDYSNFNQQLPLDASAKIGQSVKLKAGQRSGKFNLSFSSKKNNVQEDREYDRVHERNISASSREKEAALFPEDDLPMPSGAGQTLSDSRIMNGNEWAGAGQLLDEEEDEEVQDLYLASDDALVRTETLWSLLLGGFADYFRKRENDFIGKKVRIAPASPFLQLANIGPIEEIRPDPLFSAGAGQLRASDGLADLALSPARQELHYVDDRRPASPSVRYLASLSLTDRPTTAVRDGETGSLNNNAQDEELYHVDVDHNELLQQQKKQLQHAQRQLQPAQRESSTSRNFKFNNDEIALKPQLFNNAAPAFNLPEIAAIDSDRPVILWSSVRDPAGRLRPTSPNKGSSYYYVHKNSKSAEIAKLDENLAINPFQPGVSSNSHWRELNAESEPAAMPRSLETDPVFKLDAKDEFLQNTTASLYFVADSFPPIFTSRERKEIFKRCLPEIFLDDFSYAMELTDLSLGKMELRMKKIENMQREQMEILKQLAELQRQQQLQHQLQYQPQQQR